MSDSWWLNVADALRNLSFIAPGASPLVFAFGDPELFEMA